jgi:SNF2 family DNA or RNA helicase
MLPWTERATADLSVRIEPPRHHEAGWAPPVARSFWLADPPFVADAPRTAPGPSADDDTPPPTEPRVDLLALLRWVLRAAPRPFLAGLVWPAPLRPFQVDGVKALLAQDGLLLADEMGLGKTVQAAAALRLLARAGEVRQALVVCPAPLLTQWSRELGRWAPELRIALVRGPAGERHYLWRAEAAVWLVGYEALREDVAWGRIPADRVWDVVVLDEAARIKNRDSDTSRVARRLPRKRAWALTGTPLENSGEDLRTLLDFLDGPGEGLRAGSIEPRDLRRRLAACQLRRLKRDVLPELPHKSSQDVLLDLGRAQRAAYDRAEQEGIVHLRELGAEARVEHVLALLMHLKQICNADPASGASVKVDDLANRLERVVAARERALVFSQFTSDGAGCGLLAAALRRFRPLVYTGALDQRQRDEVINRFQHDESCSVLILSLRAGGVGLNLQAASYVFHFDLWWNPAVEEQAESRAHRFGQSLPVSVYRYLCTATIEERINAILATKRQLFTDLVEGAGLDLQRVFTRAELFGLFGLLPREP